MNRTVKTVSKNGKTYQRHITVVKKYHYKDRTYSYSYAHKWVHRKYGKAFMCESLDCQQLSTYFTWANMSHQYKLDITDWKQLCRSCHAKFDVTDYLKESTSKRFKGTRSTSKPINQQALDGTYIKTWLSLSDAFRELGILQSSIHNNISGRSKSAGGYKWEYANTNKVS